MLKPMRDLILIKPHEHTEHSKSGIFIGAATTTFTQDPGKAKQVTVGKVMAVGPGKFKEGFPTNPPETPIGSIVTFSDTAGIPVKDDDGTEYLLVREASIAGYLDKETDVELIYEKTDSVGVA